MLVKCEEYSLDCCAVCDVMTCCYGDVMREPRGSSSCATFYIDDQDMLSSIFQLVVDIMYFHGAPVNID